MDITDLTIRQVIAANRAIRRVRDQNQGNGQAAPGVTFPTMIMFQNAWTQNEIKGCVEGYDESVKALRARFDKTKKEKGKDVPIPWTAKDMDEFNKALSKILDKPATGVALKSFSMSEFAEMDEDEYLKEANKEHPIPQEYFSLLMEAGLLEDDVTDKPKKKGK